MLLTTLLNDTPYWFSGNEQDDVREHRAYTLACRSQLLDTFYYGYLYLLNVLARDETVEIDGN